MESLALVEHALAHVPDAIVGIREDGTIALANPRTEALFGYERDELLGEPVELLTPQRFRRLQLGRHGYEAAVGSRRPCLRVELRGRRRDGSEFPAEVCIAGTEIDDELLAVAAVRDIGERTATERVGALVGGVAHDVNNILGVILTCAELVGEEIGEGSPAYDDVEEIRRAVRRASALARRLLVDDRDAPHPRPLDVNGVLADVRRLLRRVLGEHVLLQTRPAPGLWSVEGDTGQLEQVLVNLAVNARDAMPQGGRMTIETANVALDAATASRYGDLPAGAYVRVRVRDTGVGMDGETARRAFEPFFTTKPNGDGTGLGLATVYGIVTEAGGAIRLESEPGLGTTAEVYLPAAVSRSGSSRRP